MRQGWACSVPWLLFFLWSLTAKAGPFSPEMVPGSLSLAKTTLEISYNPQHKQADWVHYELGSDQLQNCVNRTNNFRPDPELNEEDSAQLSDYKSSGFDRGHLSPASDNKWSRQAMTESFLLSNISPQPPRFNQGIWARLENLVRAWALKMGGLWVTTGPLLEDGLSTIGRNQVSTPDYYYKVLVTKNSQEKRKALALLLPVTAQGNFSSFAVSIDQLEEFTGLDFNAKMDRAEEQKLESSVRLQGWDFNANYQVPPCRRQSLQEAFFSPPQF